VLLVAGTGLLRVPYRREIVLLAVTVLGIAAFTLLFQGRARYLFAFVPIVAALAGMVHPWLPTPRPRRLQAVGGRQSGQRLR
jgi:predicted membrane channel-forming protein YqfA (hemolysin III family)